MPSHASRRERLLWARCGLFDEVLMAFEHGDVHRPAPVPADPITFTYTVQPTGLSLIEEYWP